MPPKPAPEHIRARYLLNASDDWMPTETREGSQTQPDLEEDTTNSITIGVPPFEAGEEPIQLIITEQELREKFAHFLQTEIDALRKQTNDPDYIASQSARRRSHDAREILVRVALLTVARDPTADPLPRFVKGHEESAESLEQRFEEGVLCLDAPLFHLTDSWDTHGHPETTQTTESTETSEVKARIDADLRAQTTQTVVPEWYNRMCLLSGFPSPQGCHIVPVRALEENEPSHLWLVLRMFWPLPNAPSHELLALGREETNILPLSPNARVLWDRYAFALRPISHPTDPQHRMFLQVIWLQDYSMEKSNELVFSFLTDFRRNRAGPHPGIRHGDVYELVTSDPVAHPLPNIRFLQIQLGVQKIMAGVQAAAVGGVLFAGDPPDEDDDDSLPSDLEVPAIWQTALDAAVRAGVLDDEAADQWGIALARDYHGPAIRLWRFANGEEDDDYYDEVR